MESENRAQENESAQEFDTLLDARIEGARDSTVESNEEVESALAVAERITAGRAIIPSSDFAQTLKARFLELAEAAHNDHRDASAGVPVALPPINPGQPVRRAGYLQSVLRSRRIQVATLAATVLIAVSAGLLLAAVSAPPASPLYGLRRAVHSVRVQTAANESDAAQLHVTYADQALVALTDAAKKRDFERYRAALATLVEEDSAAAATASTMPPGDQRTGVEAQVAQLRAREGDGLRMALPALGWHDRIATTAALVGIGADALSIANAEVSKAIKGKDGQHLWQVTVSGHGFQPGAILLVNESQRGVVVSVAGNLLVAEVSDGPIHSSASIGVGNPDCSAASTHQVTRHDASDNVQASPTVSPTVSPTAMPTHGAGGNPHGGTPTPAAHGPGGDKP